MRLRPWASISCRCAGLAASARVIAAASEDGSAGSAEQLSSRIEELAEEPAGAGEQVSRLAIAREEVTRVLEEPAAAASAHL